MATKYDYDAIIIGAGIGGLVCGCYLAKAGMKVLIVEKNANPGGYCTSFNNGKYRFDACVHFLGSLRHDGIVRKIMQDLDILNDIKFLRSDPSDIIFSPDYKFSFWNNIEKTADELRCYFPSEKESIKKFFSYVLKIEGYDFLKLRNKTLQDILGHYFTNVHLKELLGFPILGNTGVPPSQVSAIKAMTLYKEFMFDGGYYIPNGVQTFPEVLVGRLKEYGSAVLFGSQVKKIIVQNNKVEGIIAQQGETFTARYIISNADAYNTFFDLIGPGNIPKSLHTTLSNLKPSLSMFALYLGLKDLLPHFPQHANIWYLSGYDLERYHKHVCDGDIEDIKWFLGYYNPSEKTVLCFFNVPYINREYWVNNKNRITDLLINKIDKIFPNTSNAICYKNAATPDTMFRWTSNFQGAAYGWAGTVDQFSIEGLSQVTPLKNLFLTGHWTTLVQGISGVVYLGMVTAKTILKVQERRS